MLLVARADWCQSITLCAASASAREQTLENYRNIGIMAHIDAGKVRMVRRQDMQ